MTRYASAVLLAGLLAGTAFTRDDPKKPLTDQQLDALNRKLVEFAALDDKFRELAEKVRQNPEQWKQFLEQGGKEFRPPQLPKGQPALPPNPQPPQPNRPSDPPPPTPQNEPQFNPRNPPGQNVDIGKVGPNRIPPNLPKNLPLGQDPRLQNNPGLQRMLQFWEKNVGPLDNNPQLKAAVLDFMESAGDFQTGDGGDPNSFWSKLETEGGEASAFGDWLEKNAGSGNWKMPDFKFDGWSPSPPNVGGNFSFGGPPSVPSVGGFDLPNLPGGEATYLLLPVVFAVVVYLFWRFGPDWLRTMGRDPNPFAVSRGRWPIDPTKVSDRAGLVRAFEHISLTLCGDAARVWNHRTIAAALRAKAPTADRVADELAGLYERARYTPPGEELSPGDYAAARRCLGVLAGVTAA